MSEPKYLVTVLEAALLYPELFRRTRTDAEGKILNRGFCYDVARRLPEHTKLRLGNSLYLIRPKLEALISGKEN